MCNYACAMLVLVVETITLVLALIMKRICKIYMCCSGYVEDRPLRWSVSVRLDVKLVVQLKEFILNLLSSYVYWTVHHLDSWIKIDQLDATCFIISLFNAQHVSNVSTSILRSLRLISWVISWAVLLWFDLCWCYGVDPLGWCGIHMQTSACIRIPHHPSQTTP